MERPGSSQAFIIVVGLFATIIGLMGISLILSYLSGSYVSATPRDAGSTIGPCILGLLFVVPLVMVGLGMQSGQTDRQYLLTFVKQVCEATPLEAPAPDNGRGYTGQTHRLP